MKQYIHIIMIFFMFHGLGCISDQFQSEAHVPEGVFGLSKVNTKPLELKVLLSNKADLQGHQFLFGLLPFTELELEHVQATLYNALFTQLVTEGYALHDIHSTAPLLTIDIQRASCSAFDLLAIRKNTCTLEVLLSLEQESVILLNQKLTVSNHEYHQFGFKGRLQALMDMLMQEASIDIQELIGDIL